MPYQFQIKKENYPWNLYSAIFGKNYNRTSLPNDPMELSDDEREKQLVKMRYQEHQTLKKIATQLENRTTGQMGVSNQLVEIIEARIHRKIWKVIKIKTEQEIEKQIMKEGQNVEKLC